MGFDPVTHRPRIAYGLTMADSGFRFFLVRIVSMARYFNYPYWRSADRRKSDHQQLDVLFVVLYKLIADETKVQLRMTLINRESSRHYHVKSAWQICIGHVIESILARTIVRLRRTATSVTPQHATHRYKEIKSGLNEDNLAMSRNDIKPTTLRNQYTKTEASLYTLGTNM